MGNRMTIAEALRQSAELGTTVKSVSQELDQALRNMINEYLVTTYAVVNGDKFNDELRAAIYAMGQLLKVVMDIEPAVERIEHLMEKGLVPGSGGIKVNYLPDDDPDLVRVVAGIAEHE